MMPSGAVIRAYGSKIVLLASMGLGTLATLLTPLATIYGGYIGFGALSFINGLSLGPLFPCFHDLMVNWVPPNDLGTMISIIFSGKLAVI